MSQTIKPKSITVLAALQALLSVLLFMGAIALRFDISRRIRFGGVLDFSVLLALALIDVAITYGLWTRKSWAWLGGTIVAALCIALSVLTLFLRPTVGEVAFLLLNLMVIYFLMQPRIQRSLGHNSSN